MRLYLVRHAESSNNKLSLELPYEEYLLQRSPDPVVTEKGIRQAQLVADHLAGSDNLGNDEVNGYAIDSLYCSPMQRALQTALPISRALGLSSRIWVDIHEHGGLFLGHPRGDDVRSFGGVTRHEIAADFPGFEIGPEITDEGWWTGGYEHMAGCDERAARVAATLTAWTKERGDETIALVSHGTFIDRLLKALLHQPAENRFFYFHFNTAITRLDFADSGVIVMRYANRTQHLPAELISE